MPNTYKGTSGADVVNQTQSKDYFNIYTFGGDDEINLRLTNTWVQAGNGDDEVTNKVEGRNRIQLGVGDDTYTNTGFAKSNHHDIVYGGDGIDTMTVFTRKSDYYGDAGNDSFSSAGYWNLFVGGAGKDTVSYMAQDDDKFLKGRGVSLDLQDEFAKTGQGRKEILIGIENAEGTSRNDTVAGSSTANMLWGMNGKDAVSGKEGNDTLFGGAGGDQIYGGDGNDKLTGGIGHDVMRGDSGSDTFIFLALKDSLVGDKRDVITDFSSVGGDKIDLEAIDAIQGGGDDAFDYIGSDSFSNTAGELQFKNNVLSGDVDGDGVADFQIRVRDIASLSDSDFNL